jgi:hypothetical protein
VVRRILGPIREEAAWGWKRLHDELHNLYASPDQIKEDEMGRVCSTHGRLEKQKPLGRPRCR